MESNKPDFKVGFFYNFIRKPPTWSLPSRVRGSVRNCVIDKKTEPIENRTDKIYFNTGKFKHGLVKIKALEE